MGDVLAIGEQDEKGNPKELGKADKQANSVNKKVYNEFILSYFLI